MEEVTDLNLKKNANKGITLIALIITIIILLILAGISIATLTGENGILEKASESGQKSSMTQAEEEIKLVLNEWRIEKISTAQTFQKFLDSKVEKSEIDKYEILENANIEIDRNDYYIIVDGDGNIIENIQKISLKLIIRNKTIKLESGIEPEDYSQNLGTPLIINFEVDIENGSMIKIEPQIPYQTNGIEMEKQFDITYEIKGKQYTKTITINFSNKYEIKEPEIVPSTIDWTNENLIIDVKYGNADTSYKKEISIDGGENYHIYEGPVEIEKNTIVKARITKDLLVKESSLEITNIDKLPPNDFKPSVEDMISSTELKINATVADSLDEENRCSGIKEYKYYVYNDENLVVSSQYITSNTWNASDLAVGTTYDIIVEAFDYAGNVKSSEILSYEKKEVYSWMVYPVTSKNVYYTLILDVGSSGRFYNTDSTYYRSSIPPASGASFTFSSNDKGAVNKIVNKWFTTNGASREAKTIYYATTLTYDAGYYNYTATKRATRPTQKEYSKASDTPLRYVKSSNPEAYPEDAYQDGYWYTKQ